MEGAKRNLASELDLADASWFDAAAASTLRKWDESLFGRFQVQGLTADASYLSVPQRCRKESPARPFLDGVSHMFCPLEEESRARHVGDAYLSPEPDVSRVKRRKKGCRKMIVVEEKKRVRLRRRRFRGSCGRRSTTRWSRPTSSPTPTAPRRPASHQARATCTRHYRRGTPSARPSPGSRSSSRASRARSRREIAACSRKERHTRRETKQSQSPQRDTCSRLRRRRRRRRRRRPSSRTRL